MFGSARFLIILATAVALVFAAHSRAGDNTFSFSLGSRNYVVPAPDGYCLPTGPYADYAAAMAANESVNVTNVTFMDCNDMDAGRALSRWGFIKTPRDMVSAEITREAILADVASLPVSQLNELVAGDEVRDAASRDMAKVLGERPNLEGRVEFAGADHQAAYFLGMMQIETGGRSVEMVVGYSITSVKGRLMAYYLYELGDEPQKLAKLAWQLKRETRRLIEANGS